MHKRNGQATSQFGCRPSKNDFAVHDFVEIPGAQLASLGCPVVFDFSSVDALQFQTEYFIIRGGLVGKTDPVAYWGAKSW